MTRHVLVIFQTVDKADVLSCNYPRAFWLNWFNSTITLGEGARVGEKELLRYSNTSLYPISVIGLSTGWEADGDWEFSHMEGWCNCGVVVYTRVPSCCRVHSYPIVSSSCTLVYTCV